MLGVQTVVFHEPKAGSTDAEWEDGAGYAPVDPATGRARVVVVDGATEAYDSIRWVGQLVDGFLGIEPAGRAPGLGDLDAWFADMQALWVRNAPTSFANVFEERKFRQDGSFATFLGCDLHGLHGPRPAWSAVALGDTVLFHVRGRRRVQHFPALRSEDFGLNPEGVFTDPSARARMRRAVLTAAGDLAAGDRLFLATDAVAAWIVRADGDALWRTLGGIRHPAAFRALVEDRRRSGEMKNDDATLMRVDVTAAGPAALVVNG